LRKRGYKVFKDVSIQKVHPFSTIDGLHQLLIKCCGIKQQSRGLQPLALPLLPLVEFSRSSTYSIQG